jgi:hypothetical protein
MDIKHVGVLRLHELIRTQNELTREERAHLETCSGCMEVLRAFLRQIDEIEQERHEVSSDVH